MINICPYRFRPLLRGLAAVLLAGLVFASPGCDRGAEAPDPSDPAQAYKRSHIRIRAALEGGGPTDGATVRISTADRAETLDPHDTQNGGDVKVINQVYQTLLRIDPQTPDRLIPELATDWAIAEDGLSVTFSLREGVRFHDGATLDADAAKRSLDRLRGEYLDVPSAPYRPFYDFIEGVDAEGLKLTVRLKRPVARIALRNLSMFPAMIVSPDLLAATEGMDTRARSTYIADWAAGTGPYYLAEFDAGSARVRLEAFDGCWMGKPKVRSLVFRQVPDPAAQVLQLETGQAEMLDDVPRPNWEAIESAGYAKLHRWWALNICYLAINVEHEKTSDPAIRRAIQLAVDRDPLIKLYYGSARPTFSLVAQPLAEYDPDYRAAGLEQSVAARRAQARTLLEEAGVRGSKYTVHYPLSPRPYLPTPQKVADVLRQQLNLAGLDATIEAVRNAEYFENLRTGKYELALVGWMSDNADPDNFYVPLVGGDPETGEPSPTNAARVFDLQAHELMMQAQQVTDPQERKRLYRSIERRMQDDLHAYIPLVNTQQGIATRRGLTGVEVDPLGHYRFHDAVLE